MLLHDDTTDDNVTNHLLYICISHYHDLYMRHETRRLQPQKKGEKKEFHFIWHFSRIFACCEL